MKSEVYELSFSESSFANLVLPASSLVSRPILVTGSAYLLNNGASGTPGALFRVFTPGAVLGSAGNTALLEVPFSGAPNGWALPAQTVMLLTGTSNSIVSTSHAGLGIGDTYDGKLIISVIYLDF